jgi:hypothetical protein
VGQPVFADFVIEEKVRRGGFRRIYRKRKTMQLCEQVIDSMEYCDMVLHSWVAMSPENSFKLLRRIGNKRRGNDRHSANRI